MLSVIKIIIIVFYEHFIFSQNYDRQPGQVNSAVGKLIFCVTYPRWPVGSNS